MPLTDYQKTKMALARAKKQLEKYRLRAHDLQLKLNKLRHKKHYERQKAKLKRLFLGENRRVSTTKLSRLEREELQRLHFPDKFRARRYENR